MACLGLGNGIVVAVVVAVVAVVAFVKTYAVARGFVGSIHLEAMVRVLGHADLPLVVDTVIEHMRQKVTLILLLILVVL